MNVCLFSLGSSSCRLEISIQANEGHVCDVCTTQILKTDREFVTK